MVSKKQVGIPVAILSVIAGIAGGSYAFDFSQDNDTTIISDNSVTVGNTTSGDTNIFNQIGEGIVGEATLVAICAQDEIPAEYTNTCKERGSP